MEFYGFLHSEPVLYLAFTAFTLLHHVDLRNNNIIELRCTTKCKAVSAAREGKKIK